MALVKGLAALSRFLAKQTGKSQDQILGMFRKSAQGPLRKKFGKNVWWHGTPEQVPKGKVAPFEAFKDVRGKDAGRDLLRQGTYLAPDKEFAEQMGRRLMRTSGQEVGPTNMPLVLRKGTKFLKESPWWLEREALNPRHEFGSLSQLGSKLGYNLAAGPGGRQVRRKVRQRHILRNDFADELLNALDPNEIKVLERYTGALGTKGYKALVAYVEKTGGRAGFPGRSKWGDASYRRPGGSLVRRTKPGQYGRGQDLLDVIERYNLLPKHLRPTANELFTGKHLLTGVGPSPDKIKFFEDVARQFGSEYSGQLRKVMEKMGGVLPQVRKATLERWKKRGYSGFKENPSQEAVIWPGEEKKVLRHILADFKEEYGGLTAGLLPLISLLRGKREE